MSDRLSLTPRSEASHCLNRTISLLFALAATLSLSGLTAWGASVGDAGSPSTFTQGPPPPSIKVEHCGDSHILPAGDKDTDLEISGITCVVDGSVPDGTYQYRNVNIWAGGTLTFSDKKIDFHAHSILIENGGTLEAGFSAPVAGPITIWLYGAEDDGVPAITCKSDSRCGVPEEIWDSNPNVPMKMAPHGDPCKPASGFGPSPVGNDCFYQYEILDDGDPAGAFFGKKVLALSYGGTLFLRGKKGIRDGPIANDPSDSGTSWVRLTDNLSIDASSFHVDRPVPTWASGDHIVVTSTDYLPSHSEEVVIQSISSDAKGTLITLQKGVSNPHWGTAYDFGSIPGTSGPKDDLNGPKTLPSRHLETRAAVALLTRSIMIASEGQDPIPGDRSSPHFRAGYYGGHTVARQGFKQYQIQGVEFYQLGQGGAIGRYPVHFHMDRTVPQPTADPPFQGTYVADSSIHESNTRFITVHATQGALLARNVGYRSIGHGFYLEDATEINNRLYSNIGIQARAAVDDKLNDRKVPGIFARPGDSGAEVFPYHSDYDHPSIFWIMNTWNDFKYNAAVGAGTCGACYWMPPGGISGSSVYETWDSYAAMQTKGREGATPLMSFVGNSCSTAMNAIETVGDTNVCLGVKQGPGSDPNTLYSVPNPMETQYPNLDTGLRQKATICPEGKDCSTVAKCTGYGEDEASCAATVIDHFTTSFNWAYKNFSAIWLRGWWYLMQDSAVTDVQGAGFTAITGGGYTRSDVSQGFWNLSLRNIYVGNTQPIGSNDLPENPAASNAGPFNPGSLPCPYNPEYCISIGDGISIPVDAFGNAQRLFNIYDGPVFEQDDAYADIHVTKIGTLGGCKGGGNDKPGSCSTLGWQNGYQVGVLQYPQTNDPMNSVCLLPNAAIAWKQPNGFYYPPSFHSTGLAFQNVDIRHYVVEPLWKPNSFTTDFDQVQKQYCSWEPLMFGSNFTDIDRQTELSDDNGALTGLVSGSAIQQEPSISVNKDAFFNAPLVTPECSSSYPGGINQANATADTSPYQYVTTVVYPDCTTGGGCGDWGNNCSNQGCFGVPVYRQFLTNAEYDAFQRDPTTQPVIHMMGQVSLQRSNLTVNHGSYYIDTTVDANTQNQQINARYSPNSPPGQFRNVFIPGQTYYVFFVYARPALQQTYSMYIGKGLPGAEASVVPARVGILALDYTLTPDPAGDWLTKNYDPDTGLLTVTVNLSSRAAEFAKDLSNFCQPTTYCSYNSNTNKCGCKPGGGCTEDAVCSWGIKDIDCPTTGCFGFAVTMPPTFTAGIQVRKPAPIHFTGDPGSDPYFNKGNVTFFNVSQEIAGSCHYAAPPEQP